MHLKYAYSLGNVNCPGALALRTTCNNAYMSVNVSVRLDDALAERLRVRARAAGETLSDRLRRYAEEGARRDEHPLITFRDGPTGRRAGLIGGPDVWEVAMWVEDLAAAIGEAVRRTDLHGQTLEIAGEERTSLNDVLNRITEITGRQPARFPIPGFLANAGVAMAGMLGVKLPLTITSFPNFPSPIPSLLPPICPVFRLPSVPHAIS